MSAKKIADFIFENTGKGVNYAMRKLGIAKSEIDGLTPNQLKLYLAEKAKGSYKGRTKARDSDTGKLVVGGSALATLASIWNEIDPTKVKKMGDGTLRAEDLKKKKNGVKKKVVKKTPPKTPPKKPDSVKSIPANRTEKQTRGQKSPPPKKKSQQYMTEKNTGKKSNVKFNSRGGMLKKGKK